MFLPRFSFLSLIYFSRLVQIKALQQALADVRVDLRRVAADSPPTPDLRRGGSGGGGDFEFVRVRELSAQVMSSVGCVTKT
jgi:hypothetical protein